MLSLRVIYEDRGSAWRAKAASAHRLGEAAGWARVVASLGLAAALVFASQAGLHGGLVLLGAAALAATHLAGRVLASRRRRAERTAGFYDAGLDRLDGGFGSPRFDGEELVPSHHAYARQLDLVGPRSLFARLCAARTRAGASILLDWLLHPADGAALTARREAVEELRGRLDLREAWSVAGADLWSMVDPAAVAAWASAPRACPAGRLIESSSWSSQRSSPRPSAPRWAGGPGGFRLPLSASPRWLTRSSDDEVASCWRRSSWCSMSSGRPARC
jgi:hypothetical protein